MSQEKVVMLRYEENLQLVARYMLSPAYEDVVTCAQNLFPKLKNDHTPFVFQTSDLEMSGGKALTLTPSAWNFVISGADIEQITTSVPPGATNRTIAPLPPTKKRKAHPPSGMRVTIEKEDGSSFVLSTESSNTIYDLKDRIYNREGTPPNLHRLLFSGQQLEDGRTLSDYNIRTGSTLRMVMRLRGGKPVIYLRSPQDIDATVRVALTRDWSFSAVYPISPSQPLNDGEEIEWHVRTHTDGSLTETKTGLDVSYLYWEALTNAGITEQLSPPPSPTLSAMDVFRPSHCSFNDTDSVLLPVSSVTTYLDRALFALGLDTEARTSFITYWLPSLLKHEYILLRFIPQESYNKAAHLDIVPAPDVVTRVFMVFKRVCSDEVDLWTSASERASEPVEMWREIVGVPARAKQDDAKLFRVLEWGGMEVMKRNA